MPTRMPTPPEGVRYYSADETKLMMEKRKANRAREVSKDYSIDDLSIEHLYRLATVLQGLPDPGKGCDVLGR